MNTDFFQRLTMFGAVALVAFLIGTFVALLVTSKFPIDNPAGTSIPAVTNAATVVAPVAGEPKAKLQNEELENNSSSQPNPHTDLLNASLEELSKLPSDFDETVALYNILQQADAYRIEQLLSEAEQITQRSEAIAATNIIFARYADLDPNAAATYMFAKSPSFAMQYISVLMRPWARNDLTNAVAFASTLTGRNKQMAGISIIRARDDLSSEERSSMALELGLSNQFVQMQEFAVQYQDPNYDPAEAWATLVQEGAPIRDFGKVRNLLLRWAATDAQAAWEAFIADAPPGNTSSRMAETLARSLSHNLGKEALERAFQSASKLEDGSHRSSVQSAVLSNLAQYDPIVVLNLAETIAGGRFRDNVRRSSIRQLAGSAPREALQHIDQIESTQQRTRVQAEVIQKWSSQDINAALQWFSEQGNLNVQQNVVRGLLSSYVRQSPLDAYNWAVRQKPDFPYLVDSAISQIADTDVDTALALLSRNQGSERGEALYFVSSRLVDYQRIDEALALVRRADDSKHQYLYTQITRQIGRNSVDEALNRIKKLDRRYQDQSYIELLQCCIRDKATIDQVVSSIEDPESKAEAKNLTRNYHD